MKDLIRRLLRRRGLALVHHTDDAVLTDLRDLHETLRHSDDALRWDDSLPQPAARAHLRHLLRHHRINVVVDVGANRGQFALQLRRLGFTGRIVSFEPQADLQGSLAAAAAGDPTWVIRHCALGAAPATLTLQVFANDTFSSLHPMNSLGRHRFGELVAPTREETVAVHTLDSVWADVAGPGPHRILLKTDTQGHDLEVLEGAAGTLAATCAIVAEAAIEPIYEGAPRLADLAAWLGARGFVPSGIFPISHRREDLALIEVDAFFTRKAPTA